MKRQDIQNTSLSSVANACQALYVVFAQIFNRMKHLFSFFIFIACCATIVSAQQTNIVFIGNSITQGVILDNPLEEAPPVQAIRWLVQEISGKIEFRNCGVSGLTTVNFLPSANTFFTKVKAAADELSRKSGGILLFSIMLGTNDSALQGNHKLRMQPEQFYTNIKTITDEFLRLYPAGGHGFGYRESYSYHSPFLSELSKWLEGVRDKPSKDR